MSARVEQQADRSWTFLTNHAHVLLAIAEDHDVRLRDIADRKQAEADRELARVAEARLDFLNTVSHELRSPLNSVLGFGQLLDGELTDPRQRRQVQDIMSAGRHMLSLVNDLLDLSQMDALGSHAFPMSAVPVAEVKNVCVTDPLTLTTPSKFSVTITGSGVVGRLLIWLSQPATPSTTNAAAERPRARRMYARIRKSIPPRT